MRKLFKGDDVQVYAVPKGISHLNNVVHVKQHVDTSQELSFLPVSYWYTSVQTISHYSQHET